MGAPLCTLRGKVLGVAEFLAPRSSWRSASTYVDAWMGDSYAGKCIVMQGGIRRLTLGENRTFRVTHARSSRMYALYAYHPLERSFKGHLT